MRVAVTLAAIVCLVVAGCSAVPGDEASPADASSADASPADDGISGDATPGGGSGVAETVTPAPIPTDEAQAPPYPPGVSDASIDSHVLADTHFDLSRSTSYELTIVQTRGPVPEDADAGDGRETPAERSVTVVRQASPTRYRVDTVVTAERERGTVEFRKRLYADGETIHSAVTTNGSVSYHETSFISTDASRFDKQARSLVGRQLSVRELGVESTRIDGQSVGLPDDQPAFRIVGEGALFILPWNAVDYHVEAVVTSDGFVRSLSASYRTGTVQHTIELWYEHVGRTAVAAPDWVTYRNESTAMTSPENARTTARD